MFVTESGKNGWTDLAKILKKYNLEPESRLRLLFTPKKCNIFVGWYKKIYAEDVVWQPVTQ